MSKKRAKNDTEAEHGIVYLVTIEENCHSSDELSPDILGVFASKEAAIEAAGKYDTSSGNLEEFVKSYDEGHYTDNRKKPPDDGILFQMFDEEIDEGDYVRFYIEKMPVLDLEDVQQGKSKKSKYTDDEEEEDY